MEKKRGFSSLVDKRKRKIKREETQQSDCNAMIYKLTHLDLAPLRVSPSAVSVCSWVSESKALVRQKFVDAVH